MHGNNRIFPIRTVTFVELFYKSAAPTVNSRLRWFVRLVISVHLNFIKYQETWNIKTDKNWNITTTKGMYSMKTLTICFLSLIKVVCCLLSSTYTDKLKHLQAATYKYCREKVPFNWIHMHCFNFSAHTYQLTHSFPMHPFSTPWKHEETLRFSDVFRG